MTESTKSVDSDETEERLEAIEEALIAYYAAQQSGDSALPCPASMTIKLGEANFGTAAANPGQTGRCTGGTPAASYSSGFLRGGGVPVRDLGLPDEYAFDGWGRRIFYYVDYRATGTDPSSNPSDWNNAGAITVQDGNGAARTTRAVYALVSTGPNGHGGYTRSGNRVNTGSTNTHEIENCGISAAAPCNDAFDTVLVKKSAGYDTPGVTTDYFDDIVRYKDTRLIDRVTSGLAGDKLWSRAATGKIQAADTADSVGIGNTNPVAKLHVTGPEAYLQSTTTTEGGQLRLSGPTDNAASEIILDNYAGRFRVVRTNPSASEVLTVLQNGNVGVGSASPTSKLEVVGNASISSGLTVTSGGVTVSAGGANITGGANIAGGTNVTSGNLSVAAGTVTASGNISSTGGHFLRGGANISNIPSCDTVTQKLYWNGSAWSCINVGGGGGLVGGGGETDPKVGTTANTYVCFGTGSQVNCSSSGPRVAGQEVWATLFRDLNNGSYYVDPASASVLNDVRALVYYDQGNTGYYMVPRSWSRMNSVIFDDVRSPVYYDQANTGYYMVPRSTSRMNYVVFDNTYTYGNGNVNDVYIRSVGRWASSFASGGSVPGCTSPSVANGTLVCIGCNQAQMCVAGVWVPNINVGGCWNRSCSSCFTAGSLVTMADGTRKPIEAIEIGDAVLGGDGQPSRVIAYDRPIMGTEAWDHQSLISINGLEPFLTNNHPVLTRDGWKAYHAEGAETEAFDLLNGKVKPLTVGDAIVMEDGSELVVETIAVHEHKEPVRLYNFVLGGDPVYYVNGLAVMSFVPDKAGRIPVHLEHEGEPAAASHP